MTRPVGIFLAYAPEQSLAEHGLGRLLAMLVAGMTARGTRVVLGMPSWSVPEVRKVLEEFAIEPGAVDWVVPRHEPVLLRARRLLLRRRPGRGRLQGVGRAIARFARRLGEAVVGSLIGGFTTSSLTVFALTLGTVLLVPLAAAALLAWHRPTVLQAIAGVVILAFLARAAAQLPAVHRVMRPLRARLTKPLRPLRDFKRSAIAQRIYARMRQQETDRLLALINGREDIGCWLVPTLFWPEAARIRVPKVVVAPDLVMVDAPVHFAAHASVEGFDQLRNTIACADRLICYSEYVKENHLVRRFGIDPAAVSVIEHAPVDTRATFLKPLHSALPMRQAARNILLRHLAQDRTAQAYLRGVDLATTPFVFYASQVRPHKNLLTLVRAYEQLLRRDLVNVKLVLTGDLFAPEAARVGAYVWQRRLQFDVISLPRVSSDVLSALFALARLAVCPTLFEGGLPFTFTEALSVGTPVVMSRIPVVTEKITDEALARAMLFDPYDEADMCARMRWALEHGDELLQMQRGLYASLAQRTWQDVASDYLAAMAMTHAPAAA